MSTIATVPVEEITIKTLDELTDVVAGIPRGWWFRGQTDASWPLWPKIWREYDGETERYLTNLFYQRAKHRHAHFPDDNDYGSWLALMQHYGLPTRLLDWSNSALIAAYFATKYDLDRDKYRYSLPDCDAVIWMLDPVKLNVTQKYKNVFPSLNARSLVPTVHAAFKEDIKLADGEVIYEVLAAVPATQDLRMVMQQGAFTIHGSPQPIDKLPDSGLWLKKLTIPPDGVKRIESSLRTLGLSLAGVFPDLDHLATDLTNIHSPRSAKRAKP